ncbi:transporter substrate-binding domain-containing protein [Hydrogenophaga sp. 2FB]|uniref:substrate-binding periplasmic protein n=1 Tax=Hydrogenophaga sp. 2FB TaxID=2502187 RepID=UPI0014854B40|nr:transporter substrate-binding domain-containing protein [Hydrogenophaga sp. 2FB]
MTEPKHFADRPLGPVPWLIAMGILALCAAVFGAIESRAAAAAPLPVKALRIGVAPRSLPVSTGERDYTNGSPDAAYAQELAHQLGVEAVLVPLPAHAQATALQDGAVDLVVTRAPVGPPSPAARVLHTGHSTGLGVAMRSDTAVREWSQLAGRVVCVTADNARAQAQALRVGGRVRVFDAPAQALVRVRTGDCDAALLDRAPLDALLAHKEWAKFAATLPRTDVHPLVAWVAHEREDLAAPLFAAVNALGSTPQWAQRHQKWAANVAFEVYFDQTGPDCH